MQFFCRDILPRVRASAPGVSLSIVGRAPTPAVQRLAQTAGVDVTGRVDDVRPYLDEAQVYVVPLRIGGGTRLKIFEAMSMGKAIVSTTVGAEGLPVRDQEHLLLADDPEQFAAAVVDLLGGRDRRGALGARARSLVTGHYDWSVAAAELEHALMRVAARSAAASIPTRSVQTSWALDSGVADAPAETP
jgi:glycosyltransferase involved in cell wall biosynthesis